MFEKQNILPCEKKQRSSNLELLRIFCMFIIVMHHFALHSGFIYGQELSFNKILVQGLLLGGKLGVNCFVIISGFFLVKKTFSLKKLLKLLFQVWFYGTLLLIVAIVFKLHPIDTRIVIKSIVPFPGLNWFAEAYIVLYLIFPFINKLANSLNRNKFLMVIFLITFCWSIIPTFIGKRMGYSQTGWFIYLYLVGAYLRLYPLPIFLKDVRTQIKIFFTSVTLTFLSVLMFDVAEVKYAVFSQNATHFYSMNSIFMIIAAVSLFLIFKAVKINYSKNVNNVALTMFGVYLIHDNPLVKNFIWNSLFHNAEYTNAPNLWAHALWVIPIVLMSCAVIDWVRIVFIERPVLVLVGSKVDELQKLVDNKIEIWMNKLCGNNHSS